MRIGFDARVLTASARTGVGRYIYNLFRALGRLPGNDRFLVFQPRGRGEDYGKAFHTIRGLVPPDIREDRFLKCWYDIYLPLQIRCRGIDLFHGTSFILPRTGRARTVLSVHDITHEKFPELAPSCSPAFVRKVRESIKRADVVLVSSKSVKDDLMDIFGLDPLRIRVIYYGLDECFKPMRRPEKAESFFKARGFSPPYFFSLLAIHPRKNVSGLLKGFASFKKRTGLPHTLVLGGREYGEKNPSMEAERLGIGGSFRFAGYIPEEELPIYYSFAEAFVFPSFDEGFGFPPLEAMACGAPVLSSRAGSLPEILDAAALYFDPGEPEELAGLLVEILGSEDGRAQLRERGFAQASRYSWDKCARETLALYRELAGDSSLGARSQ